MDAVTFLAWFKHTFLPCAGNNNQLLVVDNLSAHATEEMREFAALHGVCLLFTPPNCPDLVQIADCGLGYTIKRKMKNKFVDNFSDPANTTRWQMKGDTGGKEAFAREVAV